MQMIPVYSINLSVSAYKIIWGWIGKVCIKYSCLLIIFSVLLTVEKLMSVVSELDIWEILVLQFFVLSKIFMNEVIVMRCKENASKFFSYHLVKLSSSDWRCALLEKVLHLFHRLLYQTFTVLETTRLYQLALAILPDDVTFNIMRHVIILYIRGGEIKVEGDSEIQSNSKYEMVFSNTSFIQPPPPNFENF